MAVWGAVRARLQELEREMPGALHSYPDPRDASPPGPPIGIELAPWAVDIAADLYDRFGPQLRLVVGAMSYPDHALHIDDRAFVRPHSRAEDHGVNVTLAASLRLRSGHAATHSVLVSTTACVGIELHTNGHLSSVIVDSGDRLVGAYVGAQHLPLVRFRAAPGETVEVPVLVGTASLVPDLGYAVPAGRWWLQVELPTHGRGSMQAGPLPLTIEP